MCKRRNLALYRLSYVLNSTALVMPVLPFWWTEAMGVSTSLYLSVLAAVSAVSTLIDIPLSFAADRFGVKYFYLGGLIVFRARSSLWPLPQMQQPFISMPF